MLYKTMVLGLLQDRPHLHQQLRRQKLLLRAMDFYANELKALHDDWKHHLAQTKPGRDESQTASEALEMALKELEDCLPSDSSPQGEDQPLIDAMLAFLRAPTPTE